MIVPKRSFDLVAALTGLLVLSPLFAAIAALIWIGDRGPIFFRQERVGRGGRLFRVVKFRSMVTQAELIGPQLTVGRDHRITRIGAVLRRSKLDELPQLINVVRGEMSIVGPRPEVPRYVALYTPEQREVLQLAPGITDPASEAFVDEAAIMATSADPERTYVEEIMPAKLRLNLVYANRASLASDITMIFRTLHSITVRRRIG